MVTFSIYRLRLWAFVLPSVYSQHPGAINNDHRKSRGHIYITIQHGGRPPSATGMPSPVES